MRMKKLLNSVLTVQRYEESPTRQNYFNEFETGLILKGFLGLSVY